MFDSEDTLQRRTLGEVGRQTVSLTGFEVVLMAPYQREQGAVFGPGRIDVPPTGQQMMVDEVDHVKPVGDNDGLGEVLPGDRA